MAKRREAPLSGVRAVAAADRSPVPLDDLDVALLRALVVDGRASQRALATALGVSTPTVGERMARLERSGVITGYGAQVDWVAIGLTETVYVSVNAADGADVAQIMADLWDIAEVEDVNLITGDLDLLVRLRVRDHVHLRALLMNQIWQIAGMQNTSTLLSVAEMPSKNFADGVLAHMQQKPPIGASTP